MDQNNNSGGFNQFALGFVIGGIMGILYAPKSGKENRAALQELLKLWSEKAGDLGVDFRQEVEKVKAAAQPVLNQVIEKAEPILEEIKPVIREKADQTIQLIQPIAQDLARETEEKIAEAVDPAIEKAREELNEAIEKARQEIRTNVQKRRPQFFRGV